MVDTTTQHLLKDILGFVDGHVKFAETKNAALLAFATAIIGALAQVVATNDDTILKLPFLFKLYMGMFVTLFVCAIISALYSFIPQTQKITNRKKRGCVKANKNLLFFEDIQHYDKSEYLKTLYSSTGIDNFEKGVTRLELMYAEEIIVNATIASRKFFCYKISMWFILAGIFPPLFVPLFLVRSFRSLSIQVFR